MPFVTQLRIAVFGAGAVGLYLAGRLARSGQRVILVTRPGPRFPLPLIIEEGGRRDQTSEFTAAAGWDAVPQDVVIAAVRGHQLAAALPDIHRWMGPNTQLIVVQGGLPGWYRPVLATGHSEANCPPVPDTDLDLGVDPGRVIICVLNKSLLRLDRNTVAATRGAEDRLVLGRPAGGQDEILLFLTALLRRAGLPAEPTADLGPALWERLLDMAVFDPLCAITAAPLSHSLAMPGTRPTVLKAIREAHAVALAYGRKPVLEPQARLAKFQSLADRGLWRSPMLCDRLAGRPLDLASTLGSLLHLAAGARLATPHLATLYACAAALSPPSTAALQDLGAAAGDHYLLRKRA